MKTAIEMTARGHQSVRQLEIEGQAREDAIGMTLFEEIFRTKVFYLISGAALLAAWWLVYSNLFAASRFISYHVLPLHQGTHLGSAVEFFLFEVPKVLLLLLLIVFFVGVIRSYFTPERTRRILAGNRESVAHGLAGLLGIVTPFCSCSALHGICYGRGSSRSNLLVPGHCTDGQ
jgi:uncharacterized membrane protein YraQ (UPF0718 family)